MGASHGLKRMMPWIKQALVRCKLRARGKAWSEGNLPSARVRKPSSGRCGHEHKSCLTTAVRRTLSTKLNGKPIRKTVMLGRWNIDPPNFGRRCFQGSERRPVLLATTLAMEPTFEAATRSTRSRRDLASAAANLDAGKTENCRSRPTPKGGGGSNFAPAIPQRHLVASCPQTHPSLVRRRA